jgi:hypothetical protein
MLPPPFLPPPLLLVLLVLLLPLAFPQVLPLLPKLLGYRRC